MLTEITTEHFINMASFTREYNAPVVPALEDKSSLGSSRMELYTGTCLYFDGVNDRVVGENIIQQSRNTDWCISMWVKLTTDNLGYIFDFREGGLDGYSVYVAGISNNLANLNFYDNNGTHDSGYVVPINQWVHLTFNKLTSDIITFYVNGGYVNAFASVASYNVSGNFYIGSRFNGQDYLSFRMSDFKVFDQTLLPAEIKELYENPEQAVPTGVDKNRLQLWFPMCEGAGSYLQNATASYRGTELVTDNNFTAECSPWGVTENSSTIERVDGAVLIKNPGTGGAAVRQDIDIVYDRTYFVEVTYSSNEGGYVYLGSNYAYLPKGNHTFGNHITYLSGSPYVEVKFGSSSVLNASITNVSVKETGRITTATVEGAQWSFGHEAIPQLALTDFNTYYIGDGSNGDDKAQLTGLTGTFEYYELDFITKVDVTYSNSIYGVSQYGASLYLGSSTGGYVYEVISWFFNNTSVAFLSDDFTITKGVRHTIRVQWSGNKLELLYDGSKLPLSGSPAQLPSFSSLRFFGDSDYGYSSNIIILKNTYKSSTSTYTYSPYDYGYGITISGSPEYIHTRMGLEDGKDIYGQPIQLAKSANSLRFDGNRMYGKIRGSQHLDLSGRTLEMWVFAERKMSTYAVMLSRNDNGSDRNSELYIMDSWNKYGANINGSGISGATIGEANIMKTWNHILLVFNEQSAVAKYYLNGVLSSTDYPTATNDVDADYLIADWNTWGTLPFVGQIANMRIFKFPFSEYQAKDNFNQFASVFGRTTVASEMENYISTTTSAGATVEGHQYVLNSLTRLEGI